jgi:outer membrane protein TolC
MLIGIPANALRQRPDIREAERQLAAQIARKKSAKADLWPKFYLLGSIGTESIDTGSLFEGSAKSYSFGPKITWPIFHGGAIRNNIRVQTARQEQYLAAYEQTVLNAVAEVRNALTASIQERQRNEALRRGMEAAQAALELANDRYKNGLTDFNSVISAQRNLQSLSDAYAISEGQITSDAVRLFKALGGGWAPLAQEDSGLTAGDVK